MSILRQFTWSPNAWCLFYVNLHGLLTLVVKNRIWNTQGRELLSASTQCSKRVVSGVHRDKNCFPLVHTVVSVVKSRIWSTQGQELLSASTHCSKRIVSGVHSDKNCYPLVHTVVKNHIWSIQGQELLSASTHCSKESYLEYTEQNCYPLVHTVVKESHLEYTMTRTAIR